MRQPLVVLVRVTSPEASGDSSVPDMAAANTGPSSSPFSCCTPTAIPTARTTAAAMPGTAYRSQLRLPEPEPASASAIADTTRSWSSGDGSAQTAASPRTLLTRSISARSAGVRSAVRSSGSIGTSFAGLGAQVGQHSGEPPVGPEGTRLHRADRDLELAGDLGMAELVEVLHPQQVALGGGQLVERAAYRRHVVDLLRRRRQGHERRAVGGLDVLEVAVPALASMDVDGDALRDRRQPRREWPCRVVRRRGPPGLHEGLLGRVLCEPGV